LADAVRAAVAAAISSSALGARCRLVTERDDNFPHNLYFSGIFSPAAFDNSPPGPLQRAFRQDWQRAVA
jgi:hypothetical protein